MILTRVRFEDFDRFWETFSSRGMEKRREHGCRGARVFQVSDDPAEVRVLFDWDRAGFEAFLADPEVPEIMRSAGLEGRPEPTFLEPAGELPN